MGPAALFEPGPGLGAGQAQNALAHGENETGFLGKGDGILPGDDSRSGWRQRTRASKPVGTPPEVITGW